MSIGQEIDKALSRIKIAKDRKSTVIERSKSQKSNLIKSVWKACDTLLELAGKSWCNDPLHLTLTVGGYKISCNNNCETLCESSCKWLSVERLSDNKVATFYPYDENYDKRYYSYSSRADKLFCEEVLRIYPQIIQAMAIAYAPKAEIEADIIEAEEEVGLLGAL